jgi:3-oxoacyl-[acyl-carrier protein] reductase
VSEITSAGHTANFVRMDVTVEADWRLALSTTKSEFGRVDILVNNAGWTYRRRDTLEVPENEYDRKFLSLAHYTLSNDDLGVFNINVKSIFHAVKVIMPEFLAQGSGNIVNISSCITCKPTNGLLWYTATKGAVDSITRGLAREYSPRGIRVNAVSPSIGSTALTADFVGQDFTDDVMNFNAAETPLKRLCTPLDIAKAALYFATPYFNSFQT